MLSSILAGLSFPIDHQKADMASNLDGNYSYQVVQRTTLSNTQSPVILKVINSVVVDIDNRFKEIFSQMGVSIPPAQQRLYGETVLFIWRILNSRKPFAISIFGGV